MRKAYYKSYGGCIRTVKAEALNVIVLFKSFEYFDNPLHVTISHTAGLHLCHSFGGDIKRANGVPLSTSHLDAFLGSFNTGVTETPKTKPCPNRVIGNVVIKVVLAGEICEPLVQGSNANLQVDKAAKISENFALEHGPVEDNPS